MIDPSREFPRDSLRSRLLAVQVAAKTPGDTTARGRVIVVGNADFVGDQFAQNAPENLSFALNAIDWLAQDESLIAIRSKDPRPPALAFTSAGTQETVKLANMIGVPALIVVGGGLRLTRRRRKSRVPYRSRAEETTEGAA
jgi:gliding motility-associatede transport system auxiliary component